MMGQSPAWVRHHIKILESASLVEIEEIRLTGSATKKYYRARAGAFFLQGFILPKDRRSPVIFSGSHDLAMEIVASAVTKHIIWISCICEKG